MSKTKGHQKDIERLNYQYLSMVKEDIDRGGTQFSSLVSSVRGGAKVFRNADDSLLKSFSANNAFQYRLAPGSGESAPNEEKGRKLLCETLHLYREIINSNPAVAESITGLSSEEVEFLSSLSKEEIDELAQKDEHVIQMRFVANYWKKISDIAHDGPSTLKLVTAAQAANEICNRRGEK